MIRVGLVLAAGQSRRFGTEDKLLAPFRGRPLAGWAAHAMRNVPLDHRLVVASSDDVARVFTGFDVVPCASPLAGQADNLKAGLARAIDLQADRLLICLADMPLVTHHLLSDVLDRSGDKCASATTDGTHIGPPACFARSHFPALGDLTGDRGARGLLLSLPSVAYVETHPASVQDVDTPEDLKNLAG